MILKSLSFLVALLAIALVGVERLLPDRRRRQFDLPDLSPAVQKWHIDGNFISVDGHKLFTLVKGQGPETVILVHGFPTSSFDFHRVIDDLSRDYKVVTFDHLGFGFSDKPNNENIVYSMADQADNALKLWQYMGIKKAHIVAHDMGDSVVTEILTRRQKKLLPDYFNDFFLSITFTNGGMRYKHINMRVSQRALITPYLKDFLASIKNKLPLEWTEELSRKQLRTIWSPSYADVTQREEDINNMIDLLKYKKGDLIMHKTMSYLIDRARFEPRWMNSLSQTLDLPMMVFWGDSDSVAPMEIPTSLAAEVFNEPSAASERFTGKLQKGVGHFGMLEAPESWASTIKEFLKSAEEKRKKLKEVPLQASTRKTGN